MTISGIIIILRRLPSGLNWLWTARENKDGTCLIYLVLGAKTHEARGPPMLVDLTHEY